MIRLPKVGRMLVLVGATLLSVQCGSLWAADKAAIGGKAALMDREARTGDPVYVLESLQKKRLEMEKRTKALDLREAELRRLEEKLAKRIVALEKLRVDLREDLAKETAADSENIAHLAKIFSSMKTKAAASGLKDMDQEVAVQILKSMREKVAAKVLSKMASEDAVKLANGLGLPMSEKSRP